MNTSVTPIPSATSPTPASTGSGNPGSTVSAADFMTLLVAQLQNQDPTQPIDPTQFVSQLAQFNSLQELIEIRQAVNPSAPS